MYTGKQFSGVGGGLRGVPPNATDLVDGQHLKHIVSMRQDLL